MVNFNVLSQRYATKPINDIFSEVGKVVAERELWIAVMKAQKEMGVNIPASDIEKFEKAKEDVDLAFIEERERITKHDVKAKIEAFIKVSGAGEYIHQGMTSRDLTDNVEQMQIKRASEIIFGKYISVLRHFMDKAREYDNIVLTARTHHQPAQPTLLGRRFSMWAEELYHHLVGFERFIFEYPLRGIKGPVGTQFDMLTILGDEKKVEELEKRVAKNLDFKKLLDSPGQIYPRSLDFELTSNLAMLSAACANYGIGMRLMAGHELVTEGFKEGQVGSSAMPHKMNTRSSERINGLAELVKMYCDGASRISGEQWEEADVSCSVVRRVVIPDVIYTSDGLIETTLTVLNKMGTYETIIENELERYLPFLATTEILMTAVEQGVGREIAHGIIKKYAVAEALRMRDDGTSVNNLASMLANDPIFEEKGISEDMIDELLRDKSHFVGNARRQIDQVVELTDLLISRYKKQAEYEPCDIL